MDNKLSQAEILCLLGGAICAVQYSLFVLLKPVLVYGEQALALVAIGLLFISTLGVLLHYTKQLYSPISHEVTVSLGSIMIGLSIAVVTMMFCLMNRILRQNPLVWMAHYLTGYSQYQYASVCLAWSLLIAVFVPLIKYISHRYQIRQAISRKYFHFLAIVMFAPAIAWYTEFTALAFGVGTCIMLVIEYVRIYPAISPQLSAFVGSYYVLFLDARDMRRWIVLSHIYLLLGIATPVCIHQYIFIYHNSQHFRYLWMFKHLGWITVGLGDSMGAIIGTVYGKTRWTRIISSSKSDLLQQLLRIVSSTQNNRTVEGSLGCLIGICAGYGLAGYLEGVSLGSIMDIPYLIVLGVTAVVATLTEAFTEDIDNLVMPLLTCLVYYVLAVVLSMLSE